MGKPDMAEYERRIAALERKVDMMEKVIFRLPPWALKGAGKE